MEQKKRTLDMTVGSPVRLILRFCLPIMLGSIFQQIYNITDSIVVGNAVGSRALAAVGATAYITTCVIGVTSGLANSYTILLSQSYGAKDEARFRLTLGNAVYATAGAGIVLSIVGIFGSRFLIQLMGTPTDIAGDATLYLQICVGGCVGQLVYNAAASALRAVGNSRVPLMFLIVSCLLNVVLDLVFVLALDMAVAGVALATVLSQIISAISCLIYMRRTIPLFRIERGELKPDRKILGEILRMGLPISLQHVSMSGGDLVIQGVINSFGTNAVAANAIGTRVMYMSILTFSSFSHSFSVYAGQNKGAGDHARVKLGVKQVGLLVTGLSVVSAAIVFVFGEALVRLFISQGDPQLEAIAALTMDMLRASAPFFPVLSLIWLYNGALRGVGQVTVPFLSGVTELISKIAFLFILSGMFGIAGVWYTSPIAWVLGCAVPAFWFHRLYRRGGSLIPA